MYSFISTFLASSHSAGLLEYEKLLSGPDFDVYNLYLNIFASKYAN